MNNEQIKRAIGCEILSVDKPISLEKYLHILKEDWNIRAKEDPSSYVCASSKSSEDAIRTSGIGDVEREFLPRAFPNEGIGPFDDFYIEPQSTILEIGCGFGRMTMFISGYCKKLYAVDISGELLKIARDRLSNPIYSHIEFIETSGNNLIDISDESVDIAFEYIVFQHIPSRDIVINYIKEVGRVLKPGGIFIMHGRDVGDDSTGLDPANTWHGCRVGEELVKEAIVGSQLSLKKSEGIETDRYWATLMKGEV